MPSDDFQAAPSGFHLLPRRKKAMTFTGVLMALTCWSDHSWRSVRSLGGAIGLAVLGAVMNVRLTADFHDHLPQALQGIIDAPRLSALARNPQALVSAEQRQVLRELFSVLGPQATALFDATIESLRQPLQAALSQAFLVALVVVAGAWLINFWLKEIPLRGHPLR